MCYYQTGMNYDKTAVIVTSVDRGKNPERLIQEIALRP